MKFIIAILEFFDLQMPTPQLFGWFHLLCLALTVVATVLLCRFYGKAEEKVVRRIVFITAVIVTLFEIYKQINYTFTVDGNTVISSYQWYAFPFQFCSTPMYVGLLTGIFKKGKIHDALCAYLSTFAVFAGASVMIYATDIFIGTIGINIQTVVCHGSMLVIGIYLLYSGYVKLEHKTILKALPVFAAAVLIACVMNEIAFSTGLTNDHYFNMFYVSPHCDPHLPVYSLVQPLVPYPINLIIYIAGFTLAAYIILLLCMLVKNVYTRIKTKAQ